MGTPTILTNHSRTMNEKKTSQLVYPPELKERLMKKIDGLIRRGQKTTHAFRLAGVPYSTAQKWYAKRDGKITTLAVKVAKVKAITIENESFEKATGEKRKERPQSMPLPGRYSGW